MARVEAFFSPHACNPDCSWGRQYLLCALNVVFGGTMMILSQCSARTPCRSSPKWLTVYDPPQWQHGPRGLGVDLWLVVCGDSEVSRPAPSRSEHVSEEVCFRSCAWSNSQQPRRTARVLRSSIPTFDAENLPSGPGAEATTLGRHEFCQAAFSQSWTLSGWQVGDVTLRLISVRRFLGSWEGWCKNRLPVSALKTRLGV